MTQFTALNRIKWHDKKKAFHSKVLKPTVSPSKKPHQEDEYIDPNWNRCQNSKQLFLRKVCKYFLKEVQGAYYMQQDNFKMHSFSGVERMLFLQTLPSLYLICMESKQKVPITSRYQ